MDRSSDDRRIVLVPLRAFYAALSVPLRRFLTSVWQNACVRIPLGVLCFAMGIFLFLKFYNFIKGIVRIYIVFFKKLTLYCIMLKNGQTYFKNLAV